MTAIVEQIPLDRLVKDKWYAGRGRNGNVGRWNGDVFLVIGEKWGHLVVKQEPYYTEESGCFQPFLEIDEGRMIEPFGKVAWDAHYGRKMKFGQEEHTNGS